MRARSHFLLAWILVGCLTVKCVVGVPVPVPQDEGEEEEEIGEAVQEAGDGSAAGAAPEGETVTSASEDAAALAAGAAIASPTGDIPQGLSNILESSGPGETVARADDPPAATETAEVDGEITETSEAAGEGAAAAGGAAGLLASLQDGLKENAPHVAVGGIGVAAVACVVGFSSKIIGMLKDAQAQLPDVSTISDQLKKMDGLKPGSGGNGGPNDSSGSGGNNKGPDAKAKEAMENAKEKLKSKLPWNKGAAAGGAGGAAAAGAGADAKGTEKGAGGKDVMSKKGVAENQAGPAGLAKAKQFLSKKDDIRKALQSKAGALGKAVGGGDKLGGIAEDEEPEEDLIGVKNVDSNESAPGKASGGDATVAAEQLAKIENLAENPELLKDLESLVQSPEELERLKEILQKPVQIEEIRKLVDKPEQLKLLESMLEDPSNLKKLEKSLEMSDKFEEIDTLLSKSKAGLGGLERASNLYSASPTLFGQDSSLRGDALDSGVGGGRDGAGVGGGGYQGKSEAIRRLDEILAKYNDEGQYAEGGGGVGAGRRNDDYLYGSTSGGESPGDTLSRSMDYQRYGGGGGEDSRGSTMNRSAISPYDTAYYDNSNQIRMVGEDSLDDIQRPAQFDTLSDDDVRGSPFEDPRAIADVARKQARMPSGISGRTVAKVGGGALAGAGATGAVMAAARGKTGSPTVVGKVVPAQSAVGAARKLPQPTARTAASRAIASSYARPASPITTGGGAGKLSRPAGPVKTVSTQVMSREREAEEYGSNDDLRGRRVQFRPEYDDYLYQQQTL